MPTTEAHPALTSEQQDAIRHELSNILSHSCFKTSDRCSKLLRFLVEVSLTGEEQRLKERMIGHEVFGRSITYETSADPIVRNAASELRRRLGQYHHESGDQAQAKINLIPGSYIPEFQFRPAGKDDAIKATHAELPLPPASSLASVEPSQKGKIKLRLAYAVAGIAAAISIFMIGMLYANTHKKDQLKAAASNDPFWGPIIASNQRPLISIGEEPPVTPADFERKDGATTLAFVDAKAYANIANIITGTGNGFEVRLARDTNFSALRDRPVILIGGFRNPWTLRLTHDTRYQVNRDGTRIWIEDSNEPGVHKWESEWVNHATPVKDFTYALVSRVKDPKTGGIVVTLTGLGPLGAETGSEFLVKDAYTKALPQKLLDPNTNIQLVLRTPVVDGATGPPQIVATYIW